jgi:hypothetical protein
MRTLQLCASGVFVGIVMSTACKCPLSPGHCFNNDGDQTCGEGMYCDGCRPEGNGCVGVKPSDECHYPGPVESGSTSESESTSEEPTTTSDSPMTTEPPASSTGATPCTSDDQCAAAEAPFCRPDLGECVACDAMEDPDGACAGLDQGVPLCVEGACVACTAESTEECDAQLLVCDVDAHACMPCSEHQQCDSGACQLAFGECFPPEPDTLVVDVGAGETIHAAVMMVPDGGFGVIFLHSASYAAGAHIDGNKTIALLAAPGVSPIIHGVSGDPGLRVQGAGTALYMEGVEVSFTPLGAVGVEVTEALAWLDRSRVVMNTGGGILATGDASLTLRSCFVGGDTNNVHALETDGASATVLYTTLAAGFGAATALTCNTGDVVAVRNSLWVAQTDDDEVSCPDALIEHSAAEQDLGGTNVLLDAMVPSWFENFGTGDFHLSGTHPVSIETAAQWRVGDPATDIDGEPRPTVHEAPDFAGADLRP